MLFMRGRAAHVAGADFIRALSEMTQYLMRMNIGSHPREAQALPTRVPGDSDASGPFENDQRLTFVLEGASNTIYKGEEQTAHLDVRQDSVLL
jgi:hypothetical protein